MKRRGAPLLTCVVVAGMLGACGTSTVSASSPRTTAADLPSRLTTVMAGRGFRTDIPSGWIVGHHSAGGVEIYRAAPAKGASAAAGWFTVKRMPFLAVPATVATGVDLADDPLVELVAKFADVDPPAPDATVTVEPHDLTLADEPAASITITYGEGAAQLSSQSTLIRRGTVFYELQVSSSTKRFLSLLALFEQSEDRLIWTGR